MSFLSMNMSADGASYVQKPRIIEADQLKEGENDIKVAENGGFSEVYEEFDVERVIQQQKTHDLYCPYCKQCITERVILRRKRKFQEISEGGHEESPEDAPPQVGNNQNEDIEGISCLSCFSIFIPPANCCEFWRRWVPKPPTAIPRESIVIVPVLDEPSSHNHPRPGVPGVDIIKSIVYGGLDECIASLSVIASAASGDATTLSIVGLGLANMFGGLLVLVHNLRALKQEPTTDRYEDQLGRPQHFVYHAILAAISYLVFGLMPPFVYGFSFRKSDDKDLKLAILAAVSLVCIIVLSIGKAYVKRPPKAYLQTVFKYVSLGVSVSGLGYLAGHLANMVLKKLDVFDLRPSMAMPVVEAGAVKGAYWSYY